MEGTFEAQPDGTSRSDSAAKPLLAAVRTMVARRAADCAAKEEWWGHAEYCDDNADPLTAAMYTPEALAEAGGAYNTPLFGSTLALFVG